MKPELLKRMTILRKLHEDFSIESAQFSTDKPTTLTIIFKTFESLEKFMDSPEYEALLEVYNIKYNCKETDS